MDPLRELSVNALSFLLFLFLIEKRDVFSMYGYMDEQPSPLELEIIALTLASEASVLESRISAAHLIRGEKRGFFLGDCDSHY